MHCLWPSLTRDLQEYDQCHFHPISRPQFLLNRFQILHFFQDPLERQCGCFLCCSPERKVWKQDENCLSGWDLAWDNWGSMSPDTCCSGKSREYAIAFIYCLLPLDIDWSPWEAYAELSEPIGLLTEQSATNDIISILQSWYDSCL